MMCKRTSAIKWTMWILPAMGLLGGLFFIIVIGQILRIARGGL